MKDSAGSGAMRPDYAAGYATPPKLLDRVRAQVRVRHLSLRTEEAYVGWIKRFILFHGKRHPQDMGKEEVEAFLTHLAVSGQVAASTQNQALAAVLFLYREVLAQELPWLTEVVRAKRPQRLPEVLSQAEVRRVLDCMEGVPGLIARLLYGSGLRLMEGLRLRVKDVDLARAELVVREGKGAKDRVTMLPRALVQPISLHLEQRRAVFEADSRRGEAAVYLPGALAVKCPGAATQWAWQYVFVAEGWSVDPRSGERRRHHVHESQVQRAVLAGARGGGDQARIPARVQAFVCHPLARSRAGHPYGAGVVGAFGCEHYDDLHACAQSRRPGSTQPAGSSLSLHLLRAGGGLGHTAGSFPSC